MRDSRLAKRQRTPADDPHQLPQQSVSPRFAVDTEAGRNRQAVNQPTGRDPGGNQKGVRFREAAGTLDLCAEGYQCLLGIATGRDDGRERNQLGECGRHDRSGRRVVKFYSLPVVYRETTTVFGELERGQLTDWAWYRRSIFHTY